MSKNQLQELAQRSGRSLPSYACIREGPDHAPRFKATVTYNGETFESPDFRSTLRQAEHAAAEVALTSLSERGQSLAARILDETGVFKNLLQEMAQKACVELPSYTTIRSGPGHLPLFTSTVEIAELRFTGEPARTKKQAEKHAATVAYVSLQKRANQASSSSEPPDSVLNEQQEPIVGVDALLSEHKGEKCHVSSGEQVPNLKQQTSSLQSQPCSAEPTISKFRVDPLSESSGQTISEPYDYSCEMSVASPDGGEKDTLGYEPRNFLEEPGSSCHSTVCDCQYQERRVVGDDASVCSRGVLRKMVPVSCVSKTPGLHSGKTIRSVTTLAPSVKVRQMVPVFAAPPHPSTSGEDQDKGSREEEGIQTALSLLQIDS